MTFRVSWLDEEEETEETEIESEDVGVIHRAVHLGVVVVDHKQDR